MLRIDAIFMLCPCQTHIGHKHSKKHVTVEVVLCLFCVVSYLYPFNVVLDHGVKTERPIGMVMEQGETGKEV